MARAFSIEVQHYHLVLHRWDSQESISVTISPSGYIIDARCETHGFTVELTEQEERYIMRILNIDD